MATVARHFAAAACVGVLAGCGTTPPPVAVPMSTAPIPEQRATPPEPAWRTYEEAQRRHAEGALAQGRLAEAEWAYEVLTVLRPDDRTYAEARAAVRARIGRAAADAWARGQAAQRRGDLDAAMDAYLQVLVVMPRHAAAADALRSLEAERGRRQLVGRFARPPMARRNGADYAPRTAAAPAPRAGARNHLEHATLLARQGEIDEAIAVLRQVQSGRPDAAINALLVDLHLQRARGLMTRDPEAARQSVDAALALNPRHAGALLLARQLPKPRANGPADAVKPSSSRTPGR